MKIICLLLGITLPAATRAQFFCTTNTDGSLNIAAYAGPSTNAITIPATIGDLPVTTIGNDLFQSATLLARVTIPDSVTSIGDAAFEGCTGLTNVDIPDSVTNIGINAFASDSGLAGVAISGNGCSIGDFAFQECSGLTNITIGDGVVSIGVQAFEYCSGVSSIRIGDGVTTIGNLAFEYCSGLTNVIIGKTVTAIGMNAFSECPELGQITVSESVTIIGDSAFYDDFGLRNVTVPPGVTNIGDYAFGECTNLAGIYFQGNSPGVIGTDMFFEDSGATAYYLPDSTGWSSTFGDLPAVLWNPQMEAGSVSVGAGSNQFGFNITGTTNIPVVVEACTSLAHSTWTPLLTATLTNGSIYFADSNFRNFPGRFYRIRSP